MDIEFNPSLKLQEFTNAEESGKGAAKTQVDVAGALKKMGKAYKSDAAKAREKLNNIKASNGMTYKEAKATINELEQKYMAMSKDDGFGRTFSHANNKYLKKVQDPSPKTSDGKTLAVYRFHYEIDENALSGPDKTAYRKAKAAVEEIERNYSALVSDAYSDFGLSFMS